MNHIFTKRQPEIALSTPLSKNRKIKQPTPPPPNTIPDRSTRSALEEFMMMEMKERRLAREEDVIIRREQVALRAEEAKEARLQREAQAERDRLDRAERYEMDRLDRLERAAALKEKSDMDRMMLLALFGKMDNQKKGDD